ncbi:hypothetical protein M436DRAFT_81746 [Aureobasidium namibiae CBS 147.97]|uniref:Uncharacterized protein n=1 Tax=Aureobasidium namibiae CBS 147.97 TaxID=1043004 RepID=A0A074XFH0_9PEZI|nr:uncharacterized protein M436DRAFT_81746 [Aureobasidium namibiae CBS 147.97]KEQ73361.1 hypothetical protein M436DRAFT_81746 [Aureobasidium namibiae CBS 147.97]
MPSYFLPYPKAKPTHFKKKQKPPPLDTAQKAKHPYPHPQPDPPNNPPSPLNLSPTSPTSSSSPPSSSSSSSSSPSTIKPSTHQPWHQDCQPSILKLEIVCGDPRIPSFVVVFGLRFRGGRRPKVKFSVKRGHGKAKEMGDILGLDKNGEAVRRDRDAKEEARARKRKREHGH